MSETTERLVHGDVSVGDVLPELGVDVTATTVVLGALASRDWRPISVTQSAWVRAAGLTLVNCFCCFFSSTYC